MNGLKEIDFSKVSLYQTLVMPDGHIQSGLFPTHLWFDFLVNLMQENEVSFAAKSVLDLGCATMGLSVLAYQAGASQIIGVDHNLESVLIARKYLETYNLSSENCIYDDFENYASSSTSDVVIASMILHRAREAETLIRNIEKNTKSFFILIYRPSTSAQDEFGCRPTPTELDNLVGFKAMLHTCLPKSMTLGQDISLALYLKSEGQKPKSEKIIQSSGPKSRVSRKRKKS
jgi:SAM-dependent methyltransferase